MLLEAPMPATVAPEQGVSGESPPSPLPAEELQRRAEATKRIAAAFGEIVSVLMKAPRNKHMSLTDLEWLVVPALLHGQFALAEAQHKTAGFTAPVGVLLWARVSAEVDARLTQTAGQPFRLQPHEWTSGDIIWIIDVISDEPTAGALVQQMMRGPFKGRAVKIAVRDGNGAAQVKTLKFALAPLAPSTGL